MAFLTVGEVAEYFRTTTTTIYRWLKQGKLTAVKIGKEWRIDENILENLVNRQTEVDETSVWSRLRSNEHLMVLAERNDDVSEVEVSFFKKALKSGSELMKGCWWQREEDILEQYSRKGLDAEAMLKDGTLNIFDFNKLYKKDGIDGPINAWCWSIENASARGKKLWASGSPNAACCGSDSDRLLAFEARLNTAIRNLPIIGICPYSLEDQNNRANFDKLVSLTEHHSGVVFYSRGSYALLRR